jgi:hypothetical protein
MPFYRPSRLLQNLYHASNANRVSLLQRPVVLTRDFLTKRLVRFRLLPLVHNITTTHLVETNVVYFSHVQVSSATIAEDGSLQVYIVQERVDLEKYAVLIIFKTAERHPWQGLGVTVICAE